LSSLIFSFLKGGEMAVKFHLVNSQRPIRTQWNRLHQKDRNTNSAGW
jgi:hypothetical protein